MKIKDYELIIVCANYDKNVGGYGDIYKSAEKCKEEHPNDKIIYGYYLKGESETPDWFYTIEEAIEWAVLDDIISKCFVLSPDCELTINNFGSNEDLTLYIHKDCNYKPEIDKEDWNIVTISTKQNEQWVDDTGNVHVSDLYRELERIYHYKNFRTLQEDSKMAKAKITTIESSHTYRHDDHYSIYNKMMEITGGDHEISSDAASWCELACVGETYEFREGIIEIVEEQSLRK